MDAHLPSGQQPVVLNLGTQRRLTNIVGGAITTAIGGAALGASIFGGVSGGLGARIVAGILGAFLLLVGLVYIVARATGTPPGESARLVIDSVGIRVDDPAATWALRWDEISTVRVARALALDPGGNTRSTTQTMQIRLSRPDTVANHPELSAPLSPQTVVVTRPDGQWLDVELGMDVRLKRTIEAAGARFAPSAAAD